VPTRDLARWCRVSVFACQWFCQVTVCCSVLSGFGCQSAIGCRFVWHLVSGLRTEVGWGLTVSLSFCDVSLLSSVNTECSWFLVLSGGLVSDSALLSRHFSCSFSIRLVSCVNFLLCGFFSFSHSSSRLCGLVGHYLSVLSLFLLFWAVVCVFFPCHGRCVGKTLPGGGSGSRSPSWTLPDFLL